MPRYAGRSPPRSAAYTRDLEVVRRVAAAARTASRDAQTDAYWLSANVLRRAWTRRSPARSRPSLASPWGQAVSAGDLPGGKPVYFGSYREVFARDLYEAVTGLLSVGDVATARDATRFLFERQQQPAGNMPRNSLLNGETAPDTGGIQLDETAYPILMAYLTGLSGDASLYADHVRPAADYLVAHGPSFGNERWEEQGGYSPSTIAAEIAGLTAASNIARVQGDPAHARLYQAVADDFQRTVKGFTVTHNGPYSSSPYFIRLSKNGDPSSRVQLRPRQRQRQRRPARRRRRRLPGAGPPRRAAGGRPRRAELARGARPAARHDHADRHGLLPLRHLDTVGSEDGYGDCFTPDPTDCPQDGQPWPTTEHRLRSPLAGAVR